MSKLKKSIFYSFSSKYIGLILQLVSSLIISRILSPEEIGVFAVAAGFVSLSHVLRDFGTSNYIVQEKELTSSKIKCAFLITLCTSWFLFLLLFFGKSFIASYMGHQELDTIILVLSLAFIFLPVGAVQMALMRRRMQFDVLLKINLLSTGIQVFFSVTLALLGFGVLSLALGNLVGVLTTVVACLFLALPKDRFLGLSTQNLREVLQFSSGMSAIAILKDVGRSFPEVIIAKLDSFRSAGLFTRAMGLTNLFQSFIYSSLHPVLLAHFSEQNRNGKDVYNEFMYISRILDSIAWPFFFGLSFLAYPGIVLLFGSQWGESAVALEWLSVAGLLHSMSALLFSVLTALGQLRNQLRIVIITEVIRLLGMISLANGGIMICALVIVTAELITYLSLQYSLATVLNGNFFEVIKNKFESVFICLVTTSPLLILNVLGIKVEAEVLSLLIACMPCIFIWLFTLWLLEHPTCNEIMQIWKK